MHFDSQLIKILVIVLAACAAIVCLIIGYRVGSFSTERAARKLLATREQELFTAQKGFKNLYDRETESLKQENQNLKYELDTLNKRVEEYRKKAAGFGGLFGSGSRRAEAMYALLLENETLEEALYAQNDKLREERTDALKEQMRSTGYRRVLMSQLLSDERIKSYVSDVLANPQQLPKPNPGQLPGSVETKPA